MHTLNMLEVINPNHTGKQKYHQYYINGTKVGATRWHLAQCHAQRKDCYQTTSKAGKIYHRHVIASPIDFSK